MRWSIAVTAGLLACNGGSDSSGSDSSAPDSGMSTDSGDSGEATPQSTCTRAHNHFAEFTVGAGDWTQSSQYLDFRPIEGPEVTLHAGVAATPRTFTVSPGEIVSIAVDLSPAAVFSAPTAAFEQLQVAVGTDVGTVALNAGLVQNSGVDADFNIQPMGGAWLHDGTTLKLLATTGTLDGEVQAGDALRCFGFAITVPTEVPNLAGGAPTPVAEDTLLQIDEVGWVWVDTGDTRATPPTVTFP